MPASPATAPSAWQLSRIAIDLDEQSGEPLLCLKFVNPRLEQLRQQGRQRAELAGLTAAEQAAHDGALQSGLQAAARFAEIERTIRELERAVRAAELAHEQAVDTPGVPLASVTAASEALDKAKAALRDAALARDNACSHLVRRVSVLRRDLGEAFEPFAQPIAAAAARDLGEAKEKLKAALAKVAPLLDDVVLAMSGRNVADHTARKAFVASLKRQMEQTIGVDLLDRLEREQEQAERVAAIEREAKERERSGQYVGR